MKKLKRKKGPQKITIVFFPQLFIENGLSIDGLQIKSSQPKFLDNEISLGKDSIKQISKFFYNDTQQLVDKFSYITTLLLQRKRTRKKWIDFLNRISEFVTIARFDKLSEMYSSVTYTDFNFFIFETNKTQLKNLNRLNRYPMLINGIRRDTIFVERNIVHHPYGYRTEDPSVLLRDIDQQRIIDDYYIPMGFFLSDKEKNSYLKALDWYNRSFFIPPGLDERDAVVHMETAFESLLTISDDKNGVKSRVKNAIFNLVGESSILNDWYDQFWRLRNSIVHGDTELKSFLFKAKDAQKAHLHHLYISRKIFKDCFRAILETRKRGHPMLIHEELIPNEQRMKDAIKLLTKANGSLKNAIRNGALKRISGLRKRDTAAPISATLRFGRCFFEFVLKQLNESESNQKCLASIIKKIMKCKIKDRDSLLKLFQQALYISPWHFINKHSDTEQERIKMGHAFEAFSEFMFHRWIGYKQTKGEF